MNEETQHSLVACLALGVLAALGWRGSDVSYAVAAVVAAAVGGRAVSAFANPPIGPLAASPPAAPPPPARMPVWVDASEHNGVPK